MPPTNRRGRPVQGARATARPCRRPCPGSGPPTTTHRRAIPRSGQDPMPPTHHHTSSVQSIGSDARSRSLRRPCETAGGPARCVCG